MCVIAYPDQRERIRIQNGLPLKNNNDGCYLAVEKKLLL